MVAEWLFPAGGKSYGDIYSDTDFGFHPENLGLGTDKQQSFSQWLYDVEHWSDEDWNKFYTLYSFPGTRNYIDYLYDKRADEEYLNRYGMSRSDVHDPRKLRSTRSMVGSINFVSDNVRRLYR